MLRAAAAGRHRLDVAPICRQLQIQKVNAPVRGEPRRRDRRLRLAEATTFAAAASLCNKFATARARGLHVDPSGATSHGRDPADGARLRLRALHRARPPHLTCFKQAGCEPRYIWLEVTAVSGTMPLGLLDEHWRLAVIKAASSG